MVKCAALGCFTKSGIGKVMHRFPRDPRRRKNWAVKVNRNNWRPNDNSYLCTDHFEDTQYENGRTDSLRKLKPFAMPTIFPFTAVHALNETNSHDPLRDPLAEDNDIDIIPEFEVKEEPYDFYEDNITDTGSPCWISDGVTLADDNDDDIELDSDPFQYVGKHNNVIQDEAMEIAPVPPKMPNRGGPSKAKKLPSRPRKRKKNFVQYEVGVDDYVDDDDLEVTIENASSKDEVDELTWKNQRMSDTQLNNRRMELESHMTQCKLNIKVMQARLDEERGKMMRIQNSLINLKRRQKRNELKQINKAPLKGNGHIYKDEFALKMKPTKKKVEMKSIVREREDFSKFPQDPFEMKEKMAKLRELKAKKLQDEKSSGVIDYKKQLENKLRMARLREIKAQKALERKLNEDKLTPESKIKLNIKPMTVPKPPLGMNSDDYEKLLEVKLKMARLREIRAMKALEKINSEDGNKVSETDIEPKIKKPKIKRLKIKLKLPKSVNIPSNDEEKAAEMKAKMAKLREIKAQKALERKKLEESEGISEVNIEKKVPEKSTGGKREREVEVHIKEEPGLKPEENSKSEVHIATSHMLWNVLSRIKLEPYQESASIDDTENSNSYFSNHSKKDPLPEEIPVMIKDFFSREDVSKVSTVTPNATPDESSPVRYRMHYLPILHKQFEAENGNVCSYATFCSNVPRNVVKPHGWQWKYCPCLPCINPELKFEKMMSEEILKMEGVELGDILHDDAKENTLMIQLRALRDGSGQFFTYDAWERSSSGAIGAKRRTASEPISIVVTKFLEELSMLKSHIQRTFYQYHCAKLARDRGLHCSDEVTLHIECSPVSVYRNATTEPTSSDPAAVFSVLTGYLWSQSCEQALAAVSDSKDFTTSGIWAGLEKILLSIAKAGKKKINIISDSPCNKYRNKSNFYYMREFAQTYGVCFRWIFLEQSHQMGNADRIREKIDNTIKEQMCANPDISLHKSDIQKLLLSHTSIIVDSFSNDDVNKYKWNLPKLRAVQGTQKFDEVIILPEDFWVRDVIGFDTFKKLPIFFNAKMAM